MPSWQPAECLHDVLARFDLDGLFLEEVNERQEALDGNERGEVAHVWRHLGKDRQQLRVVLLEGAVGRHVLHDVGQESVDLRFLKTKILKWTFIQCTTVYSV